MSIRRHGRAILSRHGQRPIRASLLVAEKKIVGAAERARGQVGRLAEEQDEFPIGTDRGGIGVTVSFPRARGIYAHQGSRLRLQIAEENIGRMVGVQANQVGRRTREGDVTAIAADDRAGGDPGSSDSQRARAHEPDLSLRTGSHR